MVKGEKAMELKVARINAFSIAELWFRALWVLWRNYEPNIYTVDKGSFERVHQRREFDYFVGHITNPGQDMVVHIPENSSIPRFIDMEKINSYFAEYIINPDVAPNEEYTYGERIMASLPEVLTILKKAPNTNQAIIQVGQPSDIYLENPPCLRHIDCRIKDNKLHFFIYFRSWDLFYGLPENLGGLQLLKEYMAMELNLEDGEMVVSSKGLHVYDTAWKYVKELVKA